MRNCRPLAGCEGGNQVIEKLLRKFQNHPLRLWITLGVALAVLVVAGLPAFDQLIALRAEQTKLKGELAKFQESMTRLPAVEELTAKRDALARKGPPRGGSGDQAHVFRGRVVELARRAGCQVRQIQPGERRQRDWKVGDHPVVSLTKTSSEAKGEHVIESQTISITVSGNLSDAKEFLRLLNSEEHLMHTRRLSLKPVTDSTQVLLEIELILFELNHAQQPMA